jgi:hypothetical protein
MIVTTAEPVRAETSITLAGPSESKLSRMLTTSLSGGERIDHEPRRRRGEAPGQEWMAVPLVAMGRMGSIR